MVTHRFSVIANSKNDGHGEIIVKDSCCIGETQTAGNFPNENSRILSTTSN